MVGIQIYCCDMQVAVEWFVRETKAGDGHIFSVLCSKEYYYHLRKKKKKVVNFVILWFISNLKWLNLKFNWYRLHLVLF